MVRDTSWLLEKKKSPQGKLGTQLADKIERVIVEKKIPSGMRLPSERQMAEEFNVNRGTIRNAVQLLEQRGIVEMKQGSGTCVKSIEQSVVVEVLRRYFVHTGSSTKDILALREVIEPKAAALAATNATEEHIASLKKVFEELEDSFSEDLDRYVKADVKFHEVVATATDNPMLSAIITSLREIMGILMKEDTSIHWVEKGLDTHREIYEAIKEKDPDKACKAMQIHIELWAEMLKDSFFGGK